MDRLTFIVALIGELGVLLGVIVPVIVWIKKISDGAKCQLRSDMLGTYYKHRETHKIRQYELENFISCYEAYRALGGNSFMKDVYETVMEWEIVP
jgi:hypothetical protein